MASTHDHDLVILLNAIATSCKLITSAVQRAGVAKLYGLAGEVNSTGDDQKKLDVLSNDMMINALKNSGVCCVLVSEENEEPIIVPAGRSGKFCVAFDPLDGSSNIDCNVSVGTIFSVYERKPGSDGTADDLLRSGADCICAGYVAYSSAVELVFTFRGGDVHGFCLDSTIGEFVHTREKMVFPPDGGKLIYSCNEGNSEQWDEVRIRTTAKKIVISLWRIFWLMLFFCLSYTRKTHAHSPLRIRSLRSRRAPSPTRLAMWAAWWPTFTGPFSTGVFTCTPPTIKVPRASYVSCTKAFPWP
jgi:fructose-1,6-bisphosphatase